jgi:hypothetical protein
MARTPRGAAVMNHDPWFKKYLEQFKSAASEGAIVELKLRLLADKFPALQECAHSQYLEEIEKKVGAYFADYLTEENKATLELCRQLRNKLLHGNFSVAREKLRELGITPQRGGVKRVDSATGDTEYVADTASTAGPGGIFGWLLEMGEAGDFLEAVEVFGKAEQILDWLATDAIVSP